MANELVKSWLKSFDSALQKGDVNSVVELFNEEECFWRDMITFTWNLYTAESREEIRSMLKSTLKEANPSGWVLEGEAEEAEGGVVQGLIRFETTMARGRGHVRIKGEKCWTLLTIMTELKGHEELAGSRRPLGVKHGAMKGRTTWLQERINEEKELGRSKQPYCVVIGGGQGGIAMGARLKRLGVPTIIIEKNKRPGDSWRNRYKSLYLHDPVWYDHMPYLPFPDHWPVFCSKDKIGDWLEAYTKVMELVYWSSTECKVARFDSEEGKWEVVVDKAGETITLRPQQLVLATGMFGIPSVPSFPGAENFQGVQCHSSEHKDGAEWAGKNCIVVGSNTSAHDICVDLWENGAAQITMLQRTSTHVIRSDSFLETMHPLYTQTSPFPTDVADVLFASIPYKILPRFQIPIYNRVAEKDASFYDSLEKAGFLLDFGEDGSGLLMKALRRGTGYYIDVGASELVASGEVKVRSKVEVKELKEKSLVLSDGSELEADLIVYATGYTPMNVWAAKLISQEVADKVGKCWGLGSGTRNDPGPWEGGELRNLWKPCQQSNLWFHGGNLHLSRFYSLLLALQIKARMEGIPTPIYGLPEVHHT